MTIVEGLTRKYGHTLAVDDISITAAAGRVTGRQLRALIVSSFVRQRLTMLLAKQRASDLERLTTLIESRAVTPSVDRTYPLELSPEAMRRLVAGDARGKVVITV